MDKFTFDTHRTKRFPTRVVMVGNVAVGGTNPVRIQSMTTSDTRDAAATADQIKKLADYGCEIARVTVQGMKEADTCEEIKNLLVQANYTIPLVADIHFFPPAAMRVAEFVDKVRINPGNYADKRAQFRVIEYDDASYAAELVRIEEKFSPLIKKCKERKISMRIGTNHGSLSDRIMNRFGDSPAGMVESALEYTRICRKYDYHDIIFSMKASNPIVMMQAYRMLNAEMIKLGWNYPLHLGVTEAGEGEDGRIKSAMGIGALLLDGLGDTIRVSLTEDPWYEIDPCKRLVNFAHHYESLPGYGGEQRISMFVEKKAVTLPKTVSMHRDGTVAVLASKSEFEKESFFQDAGYETAFNRPKLKIDSPDLIVYEGEIGEGLQNKIEKLHEAGVTVLTHNDLQPLKNAGSRANVQKFALIAPQNPKAIVVTDETEDEWKKLIDLKPALVFIKPKALDRFHYVRSFLLWAKENAFDAPVLLWMSYTCNEEDLVIQASTECGALFADSLADGILLEGNYAMNTLRRLSFNILQAARMRTIKTDFISCPSCGRTLFNLQEVSARIRERTAHLPGVKIAIMGCIVNGPGEMADADFGYVGSKPGKIDLYVGKTCVEKNIDFSDADDRLVALIKAHDRWIEPVVATVEA
ncbi:MAG: (E)-4-hydroxy-3-methylbut-2-enyl-diphosphate synthase [Parachlamydiales bacterium]|jgi:(E)-4-hydroxy-3-methylbut-2-enyl-diphosphate synthase